jgi:hypothetical protein
MGTFLVWVHGIGFILFLLVYLRTSGLWLMTRDIIPMSDDDVETIWVTMREFGVSRVVAGLGLSLFWPCILVLIGALELYDRLFPEDMVVYRRSKKVMDWLFCGFGKQYPVRTDDPFNTGT